MVVHGVVEAVTGRGGRHHPPHVLVMLARRPPYLGDTSAWEDLGAQGKRWESRKEGELTGGCWGRLWGWAASLSWRLPSPLPLGAHQMPAMARPWKLCPIMMSPREDVPLAMRQPAGDREGGGRARRSQWEECTINQRPLG
jgi:hypothetical protein